MRNQTTRLEGTPLIVTRAQTTEVSFRIRIKVPLKQEVAYFSPYISTAKNAWIQYFALMVPIYWLLF